jgi:putative SOS response-associated peptidase YedK
MCSHYEAPSDDRLRDAFGLPFEPQPKLDLWPGYVGPFIRRPVDTDPGDEAAPQLEALAGVFGLLPSWTKEPKKLARSTYNARSETVATKNSFRAAWKEAKHCIIPAEAIFEPDWRTGKPIPTRISRKDGHLLGIAGLWEKWRSPEGLIVFSYTMLTIDAGGHELMRQYHKGSEKRMLVILPQGLYNNWLDASPEQSAEFMRQYPADRLTAEPRPNA